VTDPHEQTLETVNVLVVDDDPVVSILLTTLLKRAGWAFVARSDGASALAYLEHDRPDVVITDVNMPEMTGLELLDAIRGDPRIANLPVALLTATDDPATSSRAESDPRTLKLLKPVRPATFVGQLREWLASL
jgi:CheY-like chemotaxis protein